MYSDHIGLTDDNKTFYVSSQSETPINLVEFLLN